MIPPFFNRGPSFRLLRRFLRCEAGAGLVEYALVVLLFLFLLFAIIDFGRLGHATVSANKATQIAARVAAVRTLACPAPPDLRFQRGDGSGPFDFGTLCRHNGIADLCAPPVDPVLTCLGSADDPTAAEIFAAVRPLLPADAEIGNLRFTYSFDPNLGFLGGPYVPMVTVEITDLEFRFVAGLGQIAGALTNSSSTLGANFTLPGISVSLPGEALAQNMGISTQ
jgi:Flp pilus assembly pilin Flp